MTPADDDGSSDTEIPVADAVRVYLRAAQGAHQRANEMRSLANALERGQVAEDLATAQQARLTAEVLFSLVGVLHSAASREVAGEQRGGAVVMAWRALTARWGTLRGRLGWLLWGR